jgi:hypothetical protein
MQDNPPVFTNGKVATVPTDVTTELPTMVSSTSTDIADPALQLSSKKIKINGTKRTTHQIFLCLLFRAIDRRLHKPS